MNMVYINAHKQRKVPYLRVQEGSLFKPQKRKNNRNRQRGVAWRKGGQREGCGKVWSKNGRVMCDAFYERAILPNGRFSRRFQLAWGRGSRNRKTVNIRKCDFWLQLFLINLFEFLGIFLKLALITILSYNPLRSSPKSDAWTSSGCLYILPKITLRRLELSPFLVFLVQQLQELRERYVTFLDIDETKPIEIQRLFTADTFSEALKALGTSFWFLLSNYVFDSLSLFMYHSIFYSRLSAAFTKGFPGMVPAYGGFCRMQLHSFRFGRPSSTHIGTELRREHTYMCLFLPVVLRQSRLVKVFWGADEKVNSMCHRTRSLLTTK